MRRVELGELVMAERRRICRVTQRLQVLPATRAVALELDDDKLAGTIERQDVRPLARVVETGELVRNDGLEQGLS